LRIPALEIESMGRLLSIPRSKIATMIVSYFGQQVEH
jgi:hypothetical protein